MRKTILRCLSVAILALLAACGGGEGDRDGGGGGGGGAGGSGSGNPPAPDTTPNAFEFQPLFNVSVNGWATSNAIVVSGFNAPVPISIEGGEYAIDGGDFTSAAGTIRSGQTLTIRAKASATYSRVVRATVTIGGVSTVFEAMSEQPSFVPDGVDFDGDDIVFLLSKTHQLVFRWSISAERYLDAYELGAEDATSIAYSSAHKRLYIGYDGGDIRYIDVASTSSAPVPFAKTGAPLSALLAAGSHVFAQFISGTPWVTQVVINAAGTITDERDGYYASTNYTWDPIHARAFFLSQGISPGDLYYAQIDQGTGKINSGGETPYHGDYTIQPPIRVSQDGRYVLLGSGDIYEQPGLTWSSALAEPVTDARWFADTSLLTLRKSGSNTTLRRQTASGETLEMLTYPGDPLRVVGSDTKLAVLVNENGTVRLHAYAPSNDSDADGVPNPQDAFPRDAAASVDSDHDGYPDAWNPGKSQADSTTGLSLDAYPQDSACYLASHGNGTTCTPLGTVPDYLPDQVVQGGDIVYLLSSVNKRVYRWSISGGAYLNPYVVGIDQGGSTIAPTTLAFSSAQQRLYLGYSTGTIHFIDVSGTGAELHFAAVARAVKGLAAAGDYLLVQDGSNSSSLQYVYNASGVITAQRNWPLYSPDYAWDPTSSRVYFLRNNGPPNDLHYAVIDQSTGQITDTGETPYEGEYNVQAPIRVSTNGQSILLGSGDIYNRSGLTWARAIGAPLKDARWLAAGSFVGLQTSGNQTSVRRLNGTTVLEQRTYAGQALRIVGSDAKMVVLLSNGSTVQFRDYVPSDDNDGDGVANSADAFPLDAAASADTDHDGHPDSWNAGKSPSDSTTGLTLDAYPNDSGCHLIAHGSGGVCNPTATVPSFVPDQIVQQGNIVYLLSSANARIYRWSIATETYLNPYVIGIDQGLGTLAPTMMTYSSAHQRLYLGYSTGAIRYFDTTTANAAESAFTTTSQAIVGLASAGNYVLAQDYGNAWATRFVFDANGAITHQNEDNFIFTDSAWDPVNSRLYSSNFGVRYEVINQSSGKITSVGGTPSCCLHDNAPPPVRVSQNGQYIATGSGGLFKYPDLSWSSSLGTQIADARWFADGSLVTLLTAGNQTILRRLSTTLNNLEQLSLPGQALRIVGSDAKMVVVTANAGATQFHIYVPSSDTDGDGVANTLDAFPLDAAASLDTDHDGYPDAWNAGKSQSDSTTGLTLDAYPNDSGCYLLSHGSGGICNPAATVPGYVPDQILTQGDTVYLLSRANRRVYRWSIATGQYLNPYPVGLDLGITHLTPEKIAYSAAHQRLYLGYATGAIRYIDTSGGNGAEVPFSNALAVLNGLTAVGNYVLAEDEAGGSFTTHYIFDANGVETDHASGYYSREYAWDPGTSRVYFFRDSVTPNDLHYAVVDQTNGEITDAGQTPYHADYDTDPPIRVSADGDVLLGSGDIYSKTLLTWEGTLGKKVIDGQWREHVLIDVDSTGKVEIRDADTRDVLAIEQVTGQPIGIVSGVTEAYVVRIVNGTTAFAKLPLGDQDGDSIPQWWEDLYGLSDADAADGSSDLDSDGVDNDDEYLKHSNPTSADTDSDGLTDSQEIVTYSTNPARADSDDDGLKDQDELITHNTDPLDADSDDDGYSDQDEVLYGGDPNDPAAHPQPLTNFSESFEGNTIPAGWVMQTGQGNVPWTIDSTRAADGAKSLKAGPLASGQSSIIRFRAPFPDGTLRVKVILEASCCWEQFNMWIDGVHSSGMYSSTEWVTIDRFISAGVHTIEWQFSRDSGASVAPTHAWIDQVTFTPR